jgi:hypothetical protein
MSNLPPMPDKSYLGDDVSWGYDAYDMRDYAEEAVRLERERQEAIRHAGAMLSNCAFNLKQRTPGMMLTAEDISALRYSQEAWDAAIRARSQEGQG